MNSFKQSSFTCSNCKKPFLFIILLNKKKIYKHCRQCGKDLYSSIDRSLSSDIYNDTTFDYFCSTCNEHYQFAQNHMNHNTITLQKKIDIKTIRDNLNKRNLILSLLEKQKQTVISEILNQINEVESAYEKNILIQKDIYYCIDTLIKGYESNKSNYYLTTNLLNNIHFNKNINFESIGKSIYSCIYALKSFSIIERNRTENSFKKIIYKVNNAKNNQIALKKSKQIIVEYRKWTLENDCYYKGEIQNNIINGFGLLYYKAILKYMGEWKNGKKEGYGILYKGGKIIYSGELKNNLKNGIGTLYDSKGVQYQGEWKDDHKEGKGIMYYANTSRYEGQWEKDKKNGFGVFFYENGELYEGEYENDCMKGKGKFYYKNGDVYIGEFYKDKKKGFGMYFYNDKTIFEGQWRNDKIGKYGVVRYANGCEFKGEWISEEKQLGVINYKNGDMYLGEIENEKKEGYGIMYYSNSNMYEGEWKKDLREGYGELYYSNGGYYKGFWRDDKRNGYGENTYNNKKFEVGQWVDNQFQRKRLFSSLFSY